MINYECAILADPESKVWEYAEQIYNFLRAKNDNYALVKVNIDRFRDGEIKPHIAENIRCKHCYFIHDSSKNPVQWLSELALINYVMRDSSADKVVDVFPYLRFARQDRKDGPRVPISARVVADIVELYADKVISLEIHNAAIQGFYSINFENLYSFPIVTHHLRKCHPEMFEDLVIMSPDGGGAKRAEAFAKVLGVSDVVVGHKSRDKPGSIASMKMLGDVKGKNVLIVDDMIDSGGTLVEAAKEAKREGAKKLYAYATHGLFTKGISALVDVFDGLFIGDTLPVEKHEKIEVISFAALFAEAIHRINEGHSLSELFEKSVDVNQLCENK
jgi:ribose-phosphate pyrophosphokinase